MKYKNAYLDVCENFNMKLNDPVNYNPIASNFNQHLF